MIHRRIIVMLIATSAMVLCGAAAMSQPIYVTDPGDSGPGTLRDAIMQSNANPDLQSIFFVLTRDAMGKFPEIVLDSPLPRISDGVNIYNPSAQQVTVRRHPMVAEFRIFEIDAVNEKVTMHGLNVFDGASSIGGGLLVNSPTAEVKLSSMYFKNNRATSGGERRGGAIYNLGLLDVTNSTFEENSANAGGAIANTNDGSLSVIQSTFVNNMATSSGGAISNNSNLIFSVYNSVFCSNSASQGGAISNGINGVMDRMVSNELAENTATVAGPDLHDLGVIAGATKNVIKSPNGSGYMLDPAMNQLGVDPNFGTLGPNGGPVPTKGKKIGLLTPGTDAGTNELGFAFDQTGGFRQFGAAPDTGSIESGNAHFVGNGDWFLPVNWAQADVPGAGNPAFVNRENTADISGQTVQVDSLGIGAAGGVNAAGTLTGAGATLNVANTLRVGTGQSDDSPFVKGEGAADLSGADVQTGDFIIGSADSGNGGIVKGYGTVTFNDLPNNTLGIDGELISGDGFADGPGSVAKGRGVFNFKGQRIGPRPIGSGSGASEASIGQGAGGGLGPFLNIAIAASNNGGDAVAEADVDIDVQELMLAGITVGGAFGGPNSTSTVTDAQVNILADTFDVASSATVGLVQFFLAPSMAEVTNVSYSVSANEHTINGGFSAGSIIAQLFGPPGPPGGGGVAMGHIGTVEATLDVRTLRVSNVSFDVAALVAAGQTANTIGHSATGEGVTVTILNSDTELSFAPVTVGLLSLSNGAAGTIHSAVLDVQGGAFRVVNTFGPGLQIAPFEANSFEPGAPPVAGSTTARAHFTDVQVTIEDGIDIAVANVNTDVAPGSFADGTLQMVRTELTTDGNVQAAIGLNTFAELSLNPSFLDIGGDLLLGEGATLSFGIEGLTRPALGAPGQYGAIDATNATLDGELVLDFDFAGVALGDMFELVRLDPTGAFTGFFDDTTVTGLPAGLGAEAAIVGTSLFATIVEAAAIPGDYYGNGIVDAADYTVWQDTFGSTTDLAADGDGDGMIDADDYDVWKMNFGAPAAGAQAAVPEPASLISMAIAMWVLTLVRKERGTPAVARS